MSLQFKEKIRSLYLKNTKNMLYNLSIVGDTSEYKILQFLSDFKFLYHFWVDFSVSNTSGNSAKIE